MSRFFIDRPIFAWVLSIVMVLAGGVCVFTLPIAQYPPIVPPTIQVTATFPGCNAATLADAVAQPIEAQVNGTEGMIYMSSTCTNNGLYTLTVSFTVGTDIHTALMLVQTRVQLALPQLPDSVQKQGVNVKIQSPNILFAVNLLSPDGRYDSLYMSNYAQINLFDELSRQPGVGLVNFLGQRSYSIRAWLDPQKLAALDMTSEEVIHAISSQNVVVSPGNIGQQPVPKGQEFQLVLSTQGRLSTSEQFGSIIVKSGNDGRIVHLRDVARIDLGAQNADINCSLGVADGDTPKMYDSVALAIYQLPSANALDTSNGVKKKMEELKKKFPQGLDYRIAYDTTPFILHSVEDVINTILIAAMLVIVVVLMFIQDWHAMLLPIMDICVALIGTFVIMKVLGFSLNNLSLFGLVLAVGIVVDDSIVVVENIERWMESGLPARDATIKAMDEITGPIIGITLVLLSVFIPTAFIPGLTGEFFRQFALTIAASACISAMNAMTLAPARAAAWIKPHGHGPNAVPREPLPRVAYMVLLGYVAYLLLGPLLESKLTGLLPAAWNVELKLWLARIAIAIPGLVAGYFAAPFGDKALNVFFKLFNKAFDLTTRGYGAIVNLLCKLSVVVLIVYAGLVALTGWGFTTAPTGFIPDQDQGYVLVNVQMPDAASVQRTTETMNKLTHIALKTPGVSNCLQVAGFSAFFQCQSSNWGTIFVVLDPFEKRLTRETQAAAIIQKLNKEYYMGVLECRAAVFGAPPVPGLGQSGGFQLQIVDRTGMGLQALQEATETVVKKANAQSGLSRVFTTFTANTPQLYLDIDRENALSMGVSLSSVFDTLNANMGSMYINQFNAFGRIWQVNVQAEGDFRTDSEKLKLLQVRNRQGGMVPLGALMTVKTSSGPVFDMRYNNLNTAAINGGTTPAFSSGQAIHVMEQICDKTLPDGMGYQWTNISYQEVTAGNTAIFIFAFAVMLVFLVLSALYESWGLPLAIILVVPMCLLSSIAGLVWLMHKPVDIFSQIGFVVLVAMAAKNAILIVEYAVQERKAGKSRREAILLASTLRLRPILMTSLAFIFGVYPLAIAVGAGWEMRRSLGTAVLSGMIGVTFFGIFLTPVFYNVVAWFTDRKATPPIPETPPPPTTEAIVPTGHDPAGKSPLHAS
ncbi:efflux RND transporter permease subunit [soil metagenome]